MTRARARARRLPIFFGRETGRATRSGGGTTFYDNFGRETGRFVQSGNYCVERAGADDDPGTRVRQR
jgi:hypothetical protein